VASTLITPGACCRKNSATPEVAEVAVAELLDLDDQRSELENRLFAGPGPCHQVIRSSQIRKIRFPPC
jgi:hypothetical protein